MNSQEARDLTCFADAVAVKLQANGTSRAAKQGLNAEPAQTGASVEDALTRKGAWKRNVLCLAAVVAVRRKAERQLHPLIQLLSCEKVPNLQLLLVLPSRPYSTFRRQASSTPKFF